jgi:hypothetical protein
LIPSQPVFALSPERTIDHVQATGRFYDLRLRVKYILFVINKAGAYIFQNRIGGVMFRASSVVERGFEHRSGQTKVACTWSMVLSGYSGFFHH